MDTNLEDSLNMESIDSMDFDHSGVVVNQEDIILEDDQDGMSMELDVMEEQSVLMDSAHEEIIVSDMIGSDQYMYQEYTMGEDNPTGANITIEANQLNELAAQNEQHLDMQFLENVNKASTSQQNIITITAKKPKKTTLAPFPRQVAIAPKPTKGAPNVQYAIAPKPVALVAVNKSKNVVQGIKGNTLLAQFGKQFVVMPANATGQKLNLASLLQPSSSNTQIVRRNDQAQLINKGTAKPVRAKYIQVQGSNSEVSTSSTSVLTKLVPVSGASTYVMQQKTVPISIGGNKMVFTTSPSKNVKVAPKSQIISIKTQSPKVVTSQANVTTKKVVISANSSQNVILKAGTKPLNTQTKSLLQTQQRSQLHPINVPGKAIQLIKLLTNQSTGPKLATKPAPLSLNAKNFVLTDSKGNIIQMSGDKVLSGQPPPLIVTSSAVTTNPNVKFATKAKKLRIAPMPHKGEPTTIATARPSQSLLAPIETPTTTVSLEEYNTMVDHNNMQYATITHNDSDDTEVVDEQIVDVKPTLASLISDAVGEENIDDNEPTSIQEVEIEYDNTIQHKLERYNEDDDNTNSMDHESSNERLDENIIIVPSNFDRHGDSYHDESNISVDDHQESENTDTDLLQLLRPKANQNYEDTSYDIHIQDTEKLEMPDLRPRKACNCTKSQCLKLYCDCFANGEFCNKCNCNNCHNNLENEELRQKAIKSCLERNPNAFRPKIGKGKTGGPEIIRRHNKGCNCKRSGCLKNYCECYEAKIACTLMCKCVGCRNVQETLERRRFAVRMRDKMASNDTNYRPPLPLDGPIKQPCSFMTPEVIEAVTQCMLASVAEGGHDDPVEDILVEFSRCMADIITASHQAL